jgi:hypothetical protein
MRLLVCGSRDYVDETYLRETLDPLGPAVTTLIEGEARGADTLAARWATDRGIPVERYPADWSQGKGAGPRRNERMLVMGQPDLVIAFPLGPSIGTWDMVGRARRARVPVLVSHHG